MKQYFLLIAFIFFDQASFSQSPIINYEIGYYFDINDIFIQGYFERDYKPEERLNVKMVLGEDFSPGYYFDSLNNKVSGLINYSQTKTSFNFKKNEKDISKEIKPKDCKGYVIGLDSFTLISDFNIFRVLATSTIHEPQFAEVIDQIGNLTFYKNVHAKENVIITYLVRSDTSDKLISFPNNINKFSEIAPPYFADFDVLENKIKEKQFTNNDIPVLVKILKYYLFYQDNKKIFYNSSWDEIEDTTSSAYYAKIISIKDSIFEMNYYFKNGTPIRKGYYYSFYPNKKHGEFLWYYPDGTIRKKINYIKNEKKSETTFYRNSTIHFQITNFKSDLTFENVNTIDGKSVLNENGNGIDEFYDSIAGKKLYFVFEKHILKNSFYISKNDTIYTHCNENASFKKIKMMQRKLDNSKFIDSESNNSFRFESLKTKSNDTGFYPISSIVNYNHGFALVKCVILPDGLVSKMDIVRSVDSDCDSSIIQFLTIMKSKQYWKPAIVNKKNVVEELILPVEFTINSFSWYRNNNWQNSNLWMFPQQFNININNHTLPPAPVFR